MRPRTTSRSVARTAFTTIATLAATATSLRHVLLLLPFSALILCCNLHPCEGFVAVVPPVASGIIPTAGARWSISNHPPPSAAASFGRRPPDPPWLLRRRRDQRRCVRRGPRDVVRRHGSGGIGMGNSPDGPPPAENSNSGEAAEEGGAVVGRHEEEGEGVTVLHRGTHHVVVSKPPSVLCHHSPYAGSRAKRDEPTPMLQRVRRALGNERRVNLVHRLDRGASGCLILAYADDGKDEEGDRTENGADDDDDDTSKSKGRGSGATAQLVRALQSPRATKTYLALVRGEGVLRGEDLPSRGWFDVDRPIKDESGVSKNATTSFLFVAGTDGNGDGRGSGARASLVLARPSTGRWHQVRRHLNGLSHPILGDSTHGNSRTNREWRDRFDLPPERLCLHLARVVLPPTSSSGGYVLPDGGLDVSCPLPDDMAGMLMRHLPGVLEASRGVVEREAGIALPPGGTAGATSSAASGDGGGNPPRVASLRARPGEGDDDDDTGGGRWDADILHRGPHHVVVYKPPAVVCHNSKWTDGMRGDGPPMLQRIRDAVSLADGGRRRRVNLVHRLDRGASGCLLAAVGDEGDGGGDGDVGVGAVTRRLAEALGSPRAVKTYVAVTVGDSLVSDDGDDGGGCDDGGGGGGRLRRGGEWFVVDRPVRDGGGTRRDSVTKFRFVAGRRRRRRRRRAVDEAAGGDGDDRGGGVDVDDDEGPTAGIVLARPSTGRYHQIRQHLRGMFRPILGDTSHGYLRTNREWTEERRGLPPPAGGSRVFLHLARLQLPATEYGDALDVSCPIPEDMMVLLSEHLPDVLDRARPVLEEEGVILGHSSSLR